MDINGILLKSALSFFVILVVFLLIYVSINKIYLKIQNRPIFDIHEYFPEDEIHSLRQIMYLFMMAACFTYIVSDLIFYNVDIWYFAVFDFAVSIVCFIDLDKTSTKNKIVAFFLIPFGTVSFLMADFTILIFFEIAHIIVMAYMIKVYYKKFNDYTKHYGLGIAVILLFAIIFFSMYFTSFSESVNLLDALVMSSNAFTSNGYAVLGKTVPGKINSLVLVWGGYIISSVSTASLTVAILYRHFNKKLENIENSINELKKE